MVMKNKAILLVILIENEKIVVFVVENYCVSSFEGESRKTLTSNNSMLLIYKVV